MRRIPEVHSMNKAKLLVGTARVDGVPGKEEPMIRAIIFDVNREIAVDETPHVLCFHQALSEVGLSLTTAEYYGTYLGRDERTFAAMMRTTCDGTCHSEKLQQVTNRKTELFRDHLAKHRPSLCPSVIEFVKAVHPEHRLAIASGGWREHIDLTLRETAIEQDFGLIVAAEDSRRQARPGHLPAHITKAKRASTRTIATHSSGMYPHRGFEGRHSIGTPRRHVDAGTGQDLSRRPADRGRP
jgi:phosphoglycolate phosphatase-like HAD superfamily hydrolase